MSLGSEKPVCALCGAILSRYRAEDEPLDLCAPCAREAAFWRLLGPLESHQLMFLIAGILISEGFSGGEPVHLNRRLASLGLVLGRDEVWNAVRKLRRRRWPIESDGPRRGYALRREASNGG